MHRQFAIDWKRGVLSAAVLLGLTGPVYAVSGVIEINQARAKAGGVTPADTPLFPVTISQPGSYRLTGNLDVTDAAARPSGRAAENTTAILVDAPFVTIDLNGFHIQGPVYCSGSPLTCSPAGVGRGIDGSKWGVTITNGSVHGMGGDGVVAWQVEKVLAGNNGGDGIRAQTAIGCMAQANGRVGIWVKTVTGCTAIANRVGGIEATTVSSSTAESNGGIGIRAKTVTGCTAIANGDRGIEATTVSSSTAGDNCASCVSGIHGIFGETVTGCQASNNGGAPQIHAAGITGQNICNGVACP